MRSGSRAADSVAIQAEGLVKHYHEVVALRCVSFDVPPGQLLAVLGPNGAGKTTLIEILEGFQAPSAGRARVLGCNPWRADRRWRARTGLVMQSTSLDSEATVRELLAVFARLYPTPRTVAEVLDIVDLRSEANTRVGVLSGGQRRRVDLAVGIVGRPDILFLDEPSTGLDPEARRHLWAGITALNRSGTTVVLTTHYLDEANHLADRIIVLAKGTIASDTTPTELRARSGPTTVTWSLPPSAPVDTLPCSLRRFVDPAQRALVATTKDVTSTLRTLVSWADEQAVELTGIDIGPPSLETAYLELIASNDDTT